MRQSQPAPAVATPSLVAAHARPLTWVPCPSSSMVAPGGRSDRRPSSAASGRAPGGRRRSPSRGSQRSHPGRWSHPRRRESARAQGPTGSGAPPGRPPCSVSGVASAGSFGTRRKSRFHSGDTARIRESRRKRERAAAGPRTVAIPREGTPRPALTTPARASTFSSSEDERTLPGFSKATRWRPVSRAASAGLATTSDSASATREPSAGPGSPALDRFVDGHDAPIATREGPRRRGGSLPVAFPLVVGRRRAQREPARSEVQPKPWTNYGL